MNTRPFGGGRVPLRSSRWMPLVLAAMLAAGCAGGSADPAEEAAFRAELAAFREARLDDLTQPDGWLTLVGLHWLHEGENTFGSDPSNDVVFPEKAPAHLGVFLVAGATVRVRIAPGVAALHDGAPVTELALATDAEPEPTVLTYGTLSWHVIRRGDRLGVRVKDRESPTRTAFHGIETFPPDRAWRVPGRFEAYDPPKPIPIADVTGRIFDEPSPGALVFEKDGVTHRLDVIRDGDEPKYFVIFADETNGRETYGGGRYLKVDEPPPGDDRVVIDFNRAYNPPCAFTPYATCPLPPRGNHLALRVEAGEKAYAKH